MAIDLKLLSLALEPEMLFDGFDAHSLILFRPRSPNLIPGARNWARRQRSIGGTRAWKQIGAYLEASHTKVIIQRLARHCGQLKPNGSSGLPLPDGRPVIGL
jgi:hypothetical protein